MGLQGRGRCRSEQTDVAQGKLSAPRSMIAGLGAGMMEAVIAVTPSETIKSVPALALHLPSTPHHPRP